MSGLFSNLLRITGQAFRSAIAPQKFHGLPTCATQTQLIAPAITNIWSSVPVRTIVRDRFPKANENKRLKKHGWRVRLKTKNGRRIIMRRILKGRFYLAH